MEKEIWKDIPGWKGYYQASNIGRIRSIRKILHPRLSNNRESKNLILSQASKDGYFIVCLQKSSYVKMMRVHRLIGMAFIPNPMNKKTINHIDGNRGNNNLANLEWATYKENSKHAYTILGNKVPWTGKYGSYHWRSKPIKQYKLNGEYLNTFEGCMDAFRKTGIDYSDISKSARGITNQAGGYKWEYIKSI